MRIVFFGASELGFECCSSILEAGHEVVGIFTIEEEFKISYSPNAPVKNYLYRDFGSLAQAHNIPIFRINGDLKNYNDQLESLKPDFLLVIGWYYMIPNKMMQLASKGAAGIHGSLLPKYRGNAPFVWAIINGESETGVSFFYFADGVDEGDIIEQRSFPILEKDTIANVLEKAKDASLEILQNSLPLIANGTAPRIKQDHSQATLFPKRSPSDGEINWEWDSERINNFIRAQTKPYPGAFTVINGKKIIIWDASIVDLQS